MVGFEESKDKEKFEIKILELARVTHVRAGGKKLRFRAAVIVGNKRGKVGLGVDSASDVAQAIEKATHRAKKNLIEVPLWNDTIPHMVQAKHGPSIVLLKPQKKGRGLIAGGTVRIICQLAGIKDISSKILGKTRSKINNALATISALKKLKPKKDANSPTEANP